jgi:hypothetical protein
MELWALAGDRLELPIVSPIFHDTVPAFSFSSRIGLDDVILGCGIGFVAETAVYPPYHSCHPVHLHGVRTEPAAILCPGRTCPQQLANQHTILPVLHWF